jgi:hypothetical protein
VPPRWNVTVLPLGRQQTTLVKLLEDVDALITMLRCTPDMTLLTLAPKSKIKT